MPSESRMGSTDFRNQPEAHAWAARFWLSGGVGVAVLPADAVLGGDQVGADALGREVGLVGHLGIAGHGAAVRAHGHPGHGLDAAADAQVRLARHHLGGRGVHRLEARGAEAVQLLARHGLGVVGVQHRDPRDVGALLAHRRHAAHDHVVEAARVQLVPVPQRLQHLGDQLDGRDLVQRAVGLAPATGRADVIEDEGISHWQSPCSSYWGQTPFRDVAKTTPRDPVGGRPGQGALTGPRGTTRSPARAPPRGRPLPRSGAPRCRRGRTRRPGTRARAALASKAASAVSQRGDGPVGRLTGSPSRIMGGGSMRPVMPAWAAARIAAIARYGLQSAPATRCSRRTIGIVGGRDAQRDLPVIGAPVRRDGHEEAGAEAPVGIRVRAQRSPATRGAWTASRRPRGAACPG